MEKFTKEDLGDALEAVASMIRRTENVRAKFKEGTPQHSLQRNRLAALNTALQLISHELSGNHGEMPTTAELEQARAPIASLISKSEKAKQKVAPSTWQHNMLEANLKGLYIASQLLDAYTIS
ncbi:MAG: hypothetical protein AA931_08685 [Peptococcaceae bacterium 1109]|jgi:hypothetical protein|nr:MAG: hypothetical protein AA931_08685 [Peptococcaceae bacterium 1109]